MTERERAITNLMAVDLRGGSHEMLSSIAKAIYKPTCGGWTIGACQVLRDTLVNLLSETDEEALREAYTKGREDGFDRGYASADDWCAQHKDAMAEHGWYRALDADKQTIRFNDDVEWELLGSGEAEHGYVVGIKIDLIAGRQSCRVKVVRDSDFQTIELMAKNLHHVKPAKPEPTVEDVLREMLDKWGELPSNMTNEAIVAEYATKLQLRGDAE